MDWSQVLYNLAKIALSEDERNIAIVLFTLSASLADGSSCTFAQECKEFASLRIEILESPDDKEIP